MPADVSALQLVLSGDAALFGIVRLSLYVSLCAVVLAALIGIPFGAWIALTKFPGRQGVIVVLNALWACRRSSSVLQSTSRSRAQARWDRSACCSRRAP